MGNALEQRKILNQDLTEMLDLCRSQLEKALEAFANLDSDLAEEIIYTESHINALDLKIDKDCEKFLALYNPVAMDLRFIMAIGKISDELERIADHAYNISKYVVEVNKDIPEHLFESLQYGKMYETVFLMFDHIIKAFNEKDVKSARKVFKKDKILDKINMDSFATIEMEIIKNTAIISEALLTFLVIKKVERVGDLIKNIAEEIIFYIDAEVLKHRKKKK